MDTEAEIRILDLWAVMLRRWKVIAGWTVGAAVFAAAVILLLPTTYTARTLLVSSATSDGGGSNLVAAQLAGSPFAGLVRANNPTQRLVGVILTSRSLADSMVHRLGAQGTAENEAIIRRILSEGTNIRSHPDGSTSVEVTGEDPSLVAQIANEFPASVNGIATSIGSRAAQQKIEFLEGQLARAREKLLHSEQELIEFQQQHATPEIQEQARRTIQAAAELQGLIIEKEIQVAQLRRTATADNPNLRAAVAELNSVREQLLRLTSGNRAGNQLFLSLGESPELKTLAGRLVREFTKDEQVYVSLTAALTNLQVEVNNNLPVVTVLDAAVVPRVPSGPKVGLILGFFALLGLLMGLIAAFVTELVGSARQNPKNEPFFTAWREFKVDLAGYVPRRRNGRVGTSVRR